ncbi:MAG: hypothetical protein V3U24_08105 [Candidatus Neomarinimicrobiota bacterium]
MEISFPNFDSLEKRVKELSQELSRARISQQGAGDKISFPEESRKKIEKKIRNLLDLLEEF